MAAFNWFNSFSEALAEKVHNLGADNITIALSNTAPGAADTVFAPLTAHPPPAAANGYAVAVAPVASSVNAAGNYTLTFGTPVVFTAVGGQIGPFRYVIFYNDSAAADEVIGWLDYGSSLTLEADETFTVDLTATTLTLTKA